MQHLMLFHSDEWNQCVDAFLRSCSKSGSAKTHANYRTHLKQFFISPAKSPNWYSRADVEEFLARPCQSVRNRGGLPSISTRNARLTTLAAFYRHSASFYVLDASGMSHPLLQVPSPTTGIPYIKVPRRPRAIAIDDLYLFFAAIPKSVKGIRDRAVYLLFFWTGRRREEIASLRYGDIQETVFRNADGTRRPGWCYFYRNKGGERRSMELPLYAKIAIDHYLEVSGRLATIGPDSPLFVAMPRSWYKGPERPLSSGVIYWTLKRYAVAAGLNPKRIFLHAFRHTAATQRWFAGQDILSIQEFLGHASLETTRGYISLLTGQSDPGALLLESKFSEL